jgi:hypothetical protein
MDEVDKLKALYKDRQKRFKAEYGNQFFYPVPEICQYA